MFLTVFLETQPTPVFAALFGVVAVLAFLYFLLRGLVQLGGQAVNNLVAGWQNVFRNVTKRDFRLDAPVPKYTLPQDQRQFLFDQLHFYKHLTPTQRRAFDNRVVQFMYTREFVPMEGVELTEDMKLLISAVGVKITFGLRSFMMQEFTRIEVYPRAYYNIAAQRYHKGEVNANGIVVLSWEDFYEGIRIPDDDLNLGLHEFAHVLAFQRLRNPVFKDTYFEDAFDKLMLNANNKMMRIAMYQRLGLRKYALTNPMEFFAVATEAFFENPVDMYRANPLVYKLFARMFNLDLIRLYSRQVQPLAN